MNFKYRPVALAVIAVLAQSTVVAETQLDAINVEGLADVPASTPLDTETLSPTRESADLLREILGVSGSRMGGHGVDPTIRGQSQTRINVLLDGAYVHGGCPNRMDPPTAYAPPGSYEEITVIKGVQTLEHGGGGSGGTILFERKTERFSADDNFRGNIEAGYRSNYDAWDVVTDLAGGSDKGFFRFIGSVTESENYEDGDGNELRTSYEEKAGTFIFGYTPSDDSRLELTFERTETDDLLFPGAGMDSPKADNDTWRLKYQTTEKLGPLAAFKAEIYRSDVEHVMDNYTLRPLTAPAQMRAPSTSDTAGGRIVSELDSSYGRWKFGIDVQNNDREADRFNDTSGNLHSVLWPGVETDQTGIFAELNHQLQSGNHVIAGLRYDRVKADASRADVDPPGGPLSPNALYQNTYGVTASEQTENNVGGLLRYEHMLENGNGLVYAGLSRSVRTADATERFIASNGSSSAGRWVGNPEIDPEKHHQLEVGIQTRLSGWSTEASIYYNDVSDYILRDRKVGSRETIYRNIDATLIGGEIQLSRRLSDNWSVSGGLAYVHAENDDDDRAIAQTPPLEGVFSLDYASGNWDGGARIRAAAKQNRVDLDSSSGVSGDGLDVRKTPSWTVFDIYASYAVNDQVSIDFGIDNVFDRDYSQHLNRSNAFDADQVQVDEPGRSAWLKVSADF